MSVSSAPAVHTPLSVEPTNTVSTANTVSTVRPAYQNSTYNMPPYGKLAASGYQDPRFAFDGIRSPVPWLDAPIFADGHPRPVTNNSYPSSVSNGNGLASARTHKLQPHASVMVHFACLVFLCFLLRLFSLIDSNSFSNLECYIEGPASYISTHE